MYDDWVIAKDGITDELNGIDIVKQVKFVDIFTLDEDETADADSLKDGDWLEDHCLGGIYLPERGIVICGECGSVVELCDICAIFVYEEWISISDAILGD